jgi:hypothetical protein
VVSQAWGAEIFGMCHRLEYWESSGRAFGFAGAAAPAMPSASVTGWGMALLLPPVTAAPVVLDAVPAGCGRAVVW